MTQGLRDYLERLQREVDEKLGRCPAARAHYAAQEAQVAARRDEMLAAWAGKTTADLQRDPPS